MSSDARVTRVVGRAVPVRGNDIDTDRIIPARYLKEVTFARMGEYPFFDERFDAAGKPRPHPFNDARFQGASILFVNRNFGCGSSREHAPQALYRFGIRAIVGESFATIFAGNCLMMGVPAVAAESAEIEELMKRAESQPKLLWALDLRGKTLSCEDGKTIPFDLPESAWKALVEGHWDSTSMLRANLEKVRKVAASLPYMTGFEN